MSREVSVQSEGRSTLVKLLKLGEDEGLTTQQAAELFGVTVDAVQKQVIRHGLNFQTIRPEIAKPLREQGVIPLRGRAPNFLPRETLRQLVRYIGTPQADAVYKQLWAR